ncbi:TonB-dependent receptor plug domain-containing protein [Temperatibacter marinus]|uniref:TonB-dependent receptor plug domain-containing protein n=1 Tax=Temperatibacter marinus TaxID=1456591 RepID=A0AA52EF68_9PROT|nr:TonB-dependent receptor plug domain-containing protein [Temperatibacter marinus]WND01705.1 TonB-dependent receptor plug domain-containing protein [Temperatibacter marinus]
MPADDNTIGICMILCLAGMQGMSQMSVADDQLQELSLQELLSIPTKQATLIETTIGEAPATITTITKEDIARSSARSLDELLRMHVPGFQTMRKSNGTAIGIRGVISDRNGKFLLMVNGRVMNERSVLGGISERFMTMLGDIEYVNVIRGPGSVIHGPGAIAGTIDIITRSGKTQSGGQISARQGFIDTFTSLEYSQTIALSNGTLYGYIGIDNDNGASTKEAEHIFSHDFVSSLGPVEAGVPVGYDLPNNGVSYRGEPRLKAHIQYNSDNLEIWARYTKGGELMSSAPGNWRERFDTSSITFRGLGYQQVTLMADYDYQVSEAFRVNFQASFDTLDSERESGHQTPEYRAYKETEFYTRVIGHWMPGDRHEIAIGLEYRNEEFGLPSDGYPNQDAFVSRRLPLGVEPWRTKTLSLMGEYQWRISDYFAFHGGLRIDDSSDLDAATSARLAAVLKPSDSDRVKLIYNSSVRTPAEEEKRLSQLRGVNAGVNESIDFFEARWERQSTDSFFFALSTFYADHSISAHNERDTRTEVLGDAEYYGVEVELNYRKDNFSLTFAHSLTELIDFTLVDPSVDRQFISAAPYGYGSDFANWHNHQTNLNMNYDFSDDMSVSASLTWLWGIPGGQDFAAYNDEVLGNITFLPISDGSTRAFGQSIFLTIGARYQLSESVDLRFHAYNVLGWLDRDLNKVNVFLRSGYYQNEAPAFGFAIDYRF